MHTNQSGTYKNTCTKLFVYSKTFRTFTVTLAEYQGTIDEYLISNPNI